MAKAEVQKQPEVQGHCHEKSIGKVGVFGPQGAQETVHNAQRSTG